MLNLIYDDSTFDPSNDDNKEIDYLLYNDDGTAICRANNVHHQFSFSDLTDEEILLCRRSGVCPSCYYKVVYNSEHSCKETNSYKETHSCKKAKVDKKSTADKKTTELKPGKLIRKLVADNLDSLTREKIEKLCDKSFCKEHFKLQYALLLDVTDKIAEEIVETRKINNHVRYSPQVYSKNNQSFLITNDLYQKNLEPIKLFF